MILLNTFSLEHQSSVQRLTNYTKQQELMFQHGAACTKSERQCTKLLPSNLLYISIMSATSARFIQQLHILEAELHQFATLLQLSHLIHPLFSLAI